MYLAKLYKDINYLDNMKKILLFTSILFFAFSLSTVKAQTIDTVIITDPILCYSEFADIEVQITQTTPVATPLNYILNYSATGLFLFSDWTSSSTTRNYSRDSAAVLQTLLRVFIE